MRKLTSILLIICLCCTWLGYHLVFNVQLSAVKSEMKAFLLNQKDHKDLIEFSFSNEECESLEWEEETEFRYEGEMYDVIEKKAKAGQIVLRCIADKKETALLLQYQKNTKRNNSNSFIVQLITSQFILPADYLLQQPEGTLKRNLRSRSSSLLKIILTVPSPPPDVC